ncbi:TPA: hypothetical protein EYO57_12920 [Candidatus Poribacteria bacterium]|nr:hypothetical protein [Candidatus Poribacteria bacterium]
MDCQDLITWLPLQTPRQVILVGQHQDIVERRQPQTQEPILAQLGIKDIQALQPLPLLRQTPSTLQQARQVK